VTHGARGAGFGSDPPLVEPVATDPGTVTKQKAALLGECGAI